ncbi:uncharacterized protein [Argopecten irradians]|uniref:uncharacterized protein n=1 Tax=Argopecten irradians TaxID=31199 RepID=UPI003716341E
MRLVQKLELYCKLRNRCLKIRKTCASLGYMTLQAGKHIRLVGDNVNFSVKITNQHQSNEGKTKVMHHAFASAALINNFNFTHLSDQKPKPNSLTVQDFLVNEDDLCSIRQVYTILIARVAVKFMPSLTFMEDVIPDDLPTKRLNYCKTEVVPLETLDKNEQKYDEVVSILDSYEKSLQEAFTSSGKPMAKVQIGGDQLTRERFSGAKCLRAGAADAFTRFDHLSPITFEMFHLLMNFLICFNKILFKASSAKELGTLKCEVDRLMRTNFDEDVRKAYDADKDFIISFVDAHLVEMVRNFFGMEDIYSPLKKHVPPKFENDEVKKRWVFTTFGQLVDDLILSKECQTTTKDVVDDGQFVTLELSSGKIIHVPIIKKQATSPDIHVPDAVFNYANVVIEMGLVYKELIDLCKLPDRDRLIRVMKQCMAIFKAKSNNSKYALECHRFLVQHLGLLSENESTKVVHSLFVNTNGAPHSHIPADLQMEYLVKDIKKHMKHMYSNKSASNIAMRTRGLSCLKSLSERYDSQSNVKERAKNHQKGSYFDDELVLVKDLQQVQPFQKQPGRYHNSFIKMPKTMLDYLNVDHFHEWISSRTHAVVTELGN